LTVVGAPVWTRGKLSHAIVAVGLGSALRRNSLPKLQKALVSAAGSLTDQLRGEV
jgi:hypothetical protein